MYLDVPYLPKHDTTHPQTKKVADVGGMWGVGDHTESVSRHVSSWG